MISKYCMNRILPCQTKSAAEGRPGWWLVIGSDCNLNKAGAAGAGPGKDNSPACQKSWVAYCWKTTLLK